MASSTGAIAWHGPHQSAHTSTITGSSDAAMASSKVASVRVSIVPIIGSPVVSSVSDDRTARTVVRGQALFHRCGGTTATVPSVEPGAVLVPVGLDGHASAVGPTRLQPAAHPPDALRPTGHDQMGRGVGVDGRQ